MRTVAFGGSDCEALHEGWLGQPVNTVSSLAFVLAGVYVLRAGGSRPAAAALGAVGVGSVLYHGPMPSWAEVVHDGSIAALPAVLVVEWRRGRLPRPPLSAVLTFAAAVLVNVLTRTDAPLCDPDSVVQGHAVWHVLTALALALWLRRSVDSVPA